MLFRRISRRYHIDSKYAIKQLFIYSFSSFEIKYCCNFVHFDNRMEINGGIFCFLTGLSELCEQ